MRTSRRTWILAVAVSVALTVAALRWSWTANEGSSPTTTTIVDPLPEVGTLRDTLRVDHLGEIDETVERDRGEGVVLDAVNPTDSERVEEAPSPLIQHRQQLAGAVEYVPVSPEEELAARKAISEEVFGAAGPFECDTICDCEPGEGCDTGAGICIPGLFGGRCCEWDDCPFGSPCVTSEGDSSVCTD